MNFYTDKTTNHETDVTISHFQGKTGVDEYHLVIRPTNSTGMNRQMESLFHAYKKALDSFGLEWQTTVFRRFFYSDLTNQTSELESRIFSGLFQSDPCCAVSRICQPPMPPANIVLWAYHIQDGRGRLDKTNNGNSLLLRRNGLSHLWTTQQICGHGGTAYEQTKAILEEYASFLQNQTMSLASDAIRTWFFVRDIDANYPDLVTARGEVFARYGLTQNTHFIASTGIDGKHQDPSVKVVMDAYAISGLRPEQLRFLQAPDYLCPTYQYGVTFERGTVVSYRDRRHVFLSGTASIDHQGNILHPGDVSGQLNRTLENMEALLKTVGAGLHDMGIFIVYIRDPEDFYFAQQKMQERFGNTPLVVVLAPVCRPGWLIEVEGLAIVSGFAPELPDL